MASFTRSGSHLSGPSFLYRKLLSSFRPSLCSSDWPPSCYETKRSCQTHTPFPALSEHIYSREGDQGETEKKLGFLLIDQSANEEKISAWLYKMRDSTLEKICAGHIPLHCSNFMMENHFIRDIAPTPGRVHLVPKYEVLKFGGRIVYCRTASEVEKATMELLNKIKAKNSAGEVPLGFDVEWKPSFKRGGIQGKTAVIQICMDGTCCYVMHIIHSGIPSILKSLLEDSSSIKVGVGVQSDATKLVKDYDVRVQLLIDLSDLASAKIVGPKRGLSSLTETTMCKRLDKQWKVRMGNWEAEILSKEQLRYAATDAFASWHLYEVLNGMPDLQIEKENPSEHKKKTKRRSRKMKRDRSRAKH